MKLFERFGPRAGAVALAALALAGCTKVGTTNEGSEGRKNAWTIPHVFRFASSEDIVGLNPAFATQATVNEMTDMCGAYLIKTDKSGEPVVPELITEIPTKANGGISADGKTITWKLRHGIKWSDGTPFSADDVVWSTQQILNPRNNVISHDGWDLITKIDEPDKYTVVYHLKQPYGPYAVTYFSSAGANPMVMPKHAFDPNASDINHAPYNALPIGIGPFKFAEWKRGDSVTMVPNPYYFRGPGKLQKVIYYLVQDRDVIVNMLKAHQLDAFLPVSPHYWPDVQKLDGFSFSATPSYFYDHIDFNTQHPMFADPVVRRALRMAIDRANILAKIDFNIYTLQEGVVPKASPLFYLPIPLVPLDIAGANKLLDGDGWKRGPDGVRVKNGQRLVVNWGTSSGSHDVDSQIELIRGTWQQIGVELDVHHYLSSLLFAPAADGGIIYGGKFDVTSFAWGGDPNQDLSNLFSCARIPPDGQNDPRYCDKTVSDLIKKGSQEYDRSKRVADMKTIQERLFADAPTIVFWSRKELRAYNSDVKGWDYLSNPEAAFDNMKDVDI